MKDESGVIPNDNKNRSHWTLQYDYDKWSFHSSIMIRWDYRSLGIGTFIINRMLEIALNYVPEVKLYGTLGWVDEQNPKNHIRRDKLYKNLGFIFNESNTGFSIDRISNLKIRKDFDYIQEVCILDVYYQLGKLQYEKERSDKILEYYKNNSNEANRKNDTLQARNKFMFFLLIALIALVILAIYLSKQKVITFC
ncbi:N-acetyltransferase [Campylobacter aviculae]|uniref:N-acetyltransferase n=1 Tax=Campylobacter aviculae TaxID=2510190 RepID=UPI001E608F0A|nr:N-acetyltransferase [Campylobacter aviculae]